MYKHKKIIKIILVILIVLLGIFGSKIYRDNVKYKNLLNKGDLAIKKDCLDKARDLFNKAREYKKSKEIEGKLNLVETIKKSKQQFYTGNKNYNEKKYLESIKNYKNVSTSDEKRFLAAQIKIIEGFINTSKIEEAEEYIKKIGNKIEKTKKLLLYRNLYHKEAQTYEKSDKKKSIHLYQKAEKYGLSLKNDKKYLKLVFNLALSEFKNNRPGLSNTKCYIGSFDKKNSYNQVLVKRSIEGSGHFSICSIYSVKDGILKEIFNDEKEQDDLNSRIDVVLKDKTTVLLAANDSTKKYTIDISKNKFIDNKNGLILNGFSNPAYNVSSEGVAVDWDVKDIDKDGISEIEKITKIKGRCNADVIAILSSYYKYDSKKRFCQFKEYNILNSQYPVKEIK